MRRRLGVLAIGWVAMSCADGGSGLAPPEGTEGTQDADGSTTDVVMTSGISAANGASSDTSGSTSCMADDDCSDLDGDPCTWPTCSDGACAEPPAVCGGPTHACAEGTCDPQTGACIYAPDDAACAGDGCQEGSCHLLVDAQGEVTGSSCDAVPLDGPTCDDLDACTTGDACQAGVCTGTPLSCEVAPAASCVGATLHRFASPGACSAGACAFDEQDVVCPLGCAGAQCVAPSHPVISEVLYDDPDADNDVWIELWAPPGSSLTGYTIEFVNGNGGSVDDTLALAGTTPANGIVLIVDPTAADKVLAAKADIFDGIADLQNGPDSVRIVDDGGVVDALGFGDFAGAVFAGEGDAAPDTAGGQSLARLLSYVDTDDNAADFRLEDAPTPGEINE